MILGIESTAHTFGIGITQGKKVLANEKASYTTKKGGMRPFEVQNHHVKHLSDIINKAMKKANASWEDIELISFSQGPGIGQMLHVGAAVARTLHTLHNIPLIGVNHCIAHLTIGETLSGMDDAVLLYASGANTQIIAYEAGKYRIFGETLDIGIGNFLDQLARHLGLGFPGGPKVAELAKKGKNLIPLPYTVKGMDVGFGGLLTHVKRLDAKKEDICYSVQETVFAMLIEVAERALAHTGKKQLVLGGGVACNERLQEMATIMCKERGAKVGLLENQFYVDNGAMIAIEGEKEYAAGKRTTDTKVLPYERTDDIEVTWKEA